MKDEESAVDRELRRALEVMPSPDFTARLRVRIANEPERSSWQLPWALVAAGVAAAAVTMAVLVLRPREEPAPLSADVALSTPRTVVFERNPESLVAQDPHPADAGLPAVVAQGFSSTVAPTAAATRHQSEFLVSAAEMRGLRHLIALANQGDTGLGALLAPPGDPAPIAPIEPVDIVIAPLTIEPIASGTD